jgi:hypothetical protein
MKWVLRFIFGLGLITLFVMLSIGSCLCSNPVSRPPDDRSAVQKCVDGCRITHLYSCDKTCRGDVECARNCTQALRDCMALCDKHEGKK